MYATITKSLIFLRVDKIKHNLSVPCAKINPERFKDIGAGGFRSLISKLLNVICLIFLISGFLNLSCGDTILVKSIPGTLGTQRPACCSFGCRIFCSLHVSFSFLYTFWTRSTKFLLYL